MKKETEQKLATALGQALEEDFKTIPEEEELKKGIGFRKSMKKRSAGSRKERNRKRPNCYGGTATQRCW